ncbi:MAG: NAD(P)/FAD-dependent oxidoreductase [Pseudomonadota bacterium]
MAKDSVNHTDMVIVGAGFAGLYMAYKARELGLDARGFDRASDVGGTWWWNRYPGARCDVESLQYSYSWDKELQQEWDWSERFATQGEILAYANHVADKHDLRRDFTFETGVKAAHWDEAAEVWNITLETGEELTSRFFVLATGCLSAARIPDFPGLEAYKGAVYHTGNWPHEGVDFAGKRVAVIGTGSSGIQVIPEIAKQAEHLTVFQRTPNYSLPARNQPLDGKLTDWWKAHYDELRRHAREETRTGTLYDFAKESALDVDEETREREYRWRWEKGGANFAQAFTDLLTNEAANVTASDFVQARIRDIVHDPETAETLTPKTYPIFTKRVCLDSQYYETYNRPNVSLVDLRKDPIKGLSAEGIETEADAHAFDAIVFATGFDAITGAITSIDIRGRNGLGIKDKWAEGPRAYLGLASAGFPNMFMITGPGSPSVLSNVIVSIEQHVEWISGLIGAMDGAAVAEAQPDAEDAWVAHVNEVASKTLMPRAASWYMGANIPGKPRVFMPYIGVGAYRKICDEIAADGYRGFLFDGVDRTPAQSLDKAG